MKKNRKIDIKVINATLTKDVCIFSTMSPYFIAGISEDKSHTSQKKLNEGKFPQFNETFSFIYNEEETLQIDIYHANRHVGGCTIYLIDIKQGGILKNEYTLKNKNLETGIITVIIHIDQNIDKLPDKATHYKHFSNMIPIRNNIKSNTNIISGENNKYHSKIRNNSVSFLTVEIDKENDLNLINLRKKIFHYSNKLYQI